MIPENFLRVSTATKEIKMEHGFNWFQYLIPGVNHHNIHIASGIFIGLILIISAILYKKSFKSLDEELIPEKGFSLKNIYQALSEGLYSLFQSIIGHDAKHYFPFLAALFVVLFVNNILGIVPGFLPATGSVSTNIALAATVFFYYNYIGIKKQGLKNYIQHLMGPVLLIAPLFFVIEIIGHVVRPITLTLRLYLNLTGDHIALGIFSDLVPFFVPVIFLAFGIFVSFVQAFVFTLLSSVYIGLANEHEEH